MGWCLYALVVVGTLIAASHAQCCCGPNNANAAPPNSVTCPGGPTPPACTCRSGPPGGGGAPSGNGGGGGNGGGSSGSVSCSEGAQFAGDTALAGTAGALLGALACVDPSAVTYRGTLAASIAGTDRSTVNIYGPFENGFTDGVPGMSCLGTNVVVGGIDTYTAEQMVRHLCDDQSMLLLDTCGDHANPRHFHELLQACLTYQDAAATNGHSTRLGTAGDGRGIYGQWEAYDTLPGALDVCGAHVGVTPDSGGVAVVHYHAQRYPPFFVGCYTNGDATTDLAACRALYSGCSEAPLTVTTQSAHTGPQRPVTS